MEIIFSIVFGAACVLPFALIARADKTKPREDEPAQDEEKDEGVGVLVRGFIYSAYRGMLQQHAHGLWRLSACLSQKSVPVGVALTALTETAKELGRFNLAPIHNAIAEIESL